MTLWQPPAQQPRPPIGDPPARRPPTATVLATTVLATIEITAEASRVKTVRRWIRGLLGQDHPVAFEAELLGCELVTNSIRHSDSARRDRYGHPGTVSITALATPEGIQLEVTDAGSACNTPRLVDAGPDAVSGRGLRMVYEIAGGRCGCRSGEAERTVWFRLGLTPADHANGGHS